jgi:hypothetical protein
VEEDGRLPRRRSEGTAAVNRPFPLYLKHKTCISINNFKKATFISVFHFTNVAFLIY